MTQYCHPVAPPAWARDAISRNKPYEACRPNDFSSFKEVPAREELVRLIIGRLISADGRDMQDDYTLPIEKEFQRKPLSWILEHTYYAARGIPLSGVQVRMKFMLPEAGGGLGWFDLNQSPDELKLKDSDIVEVLITSDAVDSTAGENWPASWQEAVAYLSEIKSAKYANSDRWIPKVWATVEKYADDDNVAQPGLECFSGYVEGKDKDAAKKVVSAAGSVRILQRVLARHSGSAEVQSVGWSLASKLSSESSAQPLFVQRGGIRSLAKKFDNSPEVSDTKVQSTIKAFIKGMGSVKGPDTATRSSGEAVANPFLSKSGQTRASRTAVATDPCKQAAIGLERAMRQNDTLKIDKILRALVEKMRVYAFDYKAAEEAGLGRLLGELIAFDGDADVRELARKGVQMLVRLQINDPLR